MVKKMAEKYGLTVGFRVRKMFADKDGKKPSWVVFYSGIDEELVKFLIEKEWGYISYQFDPHWGHSEVRECRDVVERSCTLFFDDGDTMGVWNPKLPVELQDVLSEGQGVNLWSFIRKIKDGEIILSSQAVGMTAENTCPKCSGRLRSWATRETTRYKCELCDYNLEVQV